MIELFDAQVARRVSYIHSRGLTRAADRLPSNVGRASLVHNLTSAIGLLHDQTVESDTDNIARAVVVESVPATRDELVRFHDPAFVGQSLLPVSTR